jgi:phosphoglycolate phosphatase
MSKNYDLIVFDWDGTVMDSTAVIAGSIQAACRDLDLPVPSDETARHVIGMGLRDALQYAVPGVSEDMYEQLTARYRRHFLAHDASIPLYDGARETIAELHGTGVSLAVATGKSRNGLDRALSSSQMTSFFHASRTADETFSKPHPAMLLELMEELDIKPERTLMVGDTTHDLKMAANAGVDALAMTHGAHPEEHLSMLKTVAMLGNFSELRGWLVAYA